MFAWLLFLLVFFVNRHRIEIFRLVYLAAIEAADVVDAIAPIQKFGSIVLTTLHREINPYSRLSDPSVKPIAGLHLILFMPGRCCSVEFGKGRNGRRTLS